MWLKKHEHMRVASHLPPRPIPRVPFPPRLPCVRIWARRGARGGAALYVVNWLEIVSRP